MEPAPYRDRSLSGRMERVRDAGRRADEVWLIFDNTAEGEGTGDALRARKLLGGS